MELILNGNGVNVKTNKGNFEVVTNGKSEVFSPKALKKILISTSTIITTDALTLAENNNIIFDFLNKDSMFS